MDCSTNVNVGVESIQECMRLTNKFSIAPQQNNAKDISACASINEQTFTDMDQKVEKIDYNFFEEDIAASRIQHSHQADQILE